MKGLGATSIVIFGGALVGVIAFFIFGQRETVTHKITFPDLPTDGIFSSLAALVNPPAPPACKTLYGFRFCPPGGDASNYPGLTDEEVKNAGGAN